MRTHLCFSYDISLSLFTDWLLFWLFTAAVIRLNSAIKSGCFHLFFWWIRPSFFRLRKPLKGSWKCGTHQFHKEGRELSKMSFFHRTKWNVMHFLMLLRLRYVGTTALKLSLQQNTRMRLVFSCFTFTFAPKSHDFLIQNYYVASVFLEIFRH